MRGHPLCGKIKKSSGSATKDPQPGFFIFSFYPEGFDSEKGASAPFSLHFFSHLIL